MSSVHGWPFLTVAWLSLGQVLFAFAFIYLLVLGDHHLAERIRTHEHPVPPGESVSDHTHGFAQPHTHEPGASTWSASSSPALVPASTATVPAILSLTDLLPPGAVPPSASLRWLPAILMALVLAHQLLMRPTTPPPMGAPAAR